MSCPKDDASTSNFGFPLYISSEDDDTVPDNFVEQIIDISLAEDIFALHIDVVKSRPFKVAAPESTACKVLADPEITKSELPDAVILKLGTSLNPDKTASLEELNLISDISGTSISIRKVFTIIEPFIFAINVPFETVVDTFFNILSLAITFTDCVLFFVIIIFIPSETSILSNALKALVSEIVFPDSLVIPFSLPHDKSRNKKSTNMICKYVFFILLIFNNVNLLN